jgi:hypothetical protein
MMRAETIVRACAFALVVAGTSILAAPQQTTMQPGQMTKGRVWVENRGRNEAIPIDLRDVNLDAPLKIQVMNGDPAATRMNPVLVTEARKTWEYAIVSIGPHDDMAALLNARGGAGWETTGISFAAADDIKLLLKRPR